MAASPWLCRSCHTKLKVDKSFTALPTLDLKPSDPPNLTREFPSRLLASSKNYKLLSAFLTFTTENGSLNFTIFDKPNCRHFALRVLSTYPLLTLPLSTPVRRKIVGPLMCRKRHKILGELIAVTSDETVLTPIASDRWRQGLQRDHRWDNTTREQNFETATSSHIVKVTSPSHDPEHSVFISAFLEIRHTPKSNGTTAIRSIHRTTWCILGHSKFHYFD